MKTNFLQNEIERLAALHNCGILDTAPQTEFDDLTNLAAHICRTPAAFIGLIDGKRQWFKSRIGFTVTELPRETAFCSYTILRPENILIVEDLTLDERFAANPLVTDAPFVRFYAGVPLITDDGFAIGTLCVIDYQPRILSPEQIESLKLLTRQTASQIKLHLLTRNEAIFSARLKTAVLTKISHEIRTPMNGIIGMTELLLDTPLDHTGRDYAETIRESAEELLTAVNNILDLSKVEVKMRYFKADDSDIYEPEKPAVELFAEREKTETAFQILK